ncbi:MAG: hypothetical protein MUC33_07140 [Desulfobacterales bacterium]|nr:hypothetical protein [Desulfobacterales bacterium]
MTRIFEVLATAPEDPWALERLLGEVGASDPRLSGRLVEGLSSLGQAIADLKRLQASSDVSLEASGAMLDAARNLNTAIRSLSKVGGSAYPALGADLIEFIVLTRLRLAAPLFYQLAIMVGLIQVRVLPTIEINEEMVRFPRPMDHLVFERIGTFFSDPWKAIREQLPSPPLATVANAERTADIVVSRIGGVLNALDVPWAYGFPAGDERYLGESAEQAAHTLIIYVPTRIAGDDVNAGVCIHLSSADADDLGVVLTPFGSLNIEGAFGRWNVGLELTAGMEALAFGGGQGVRILAGSPAAAVDATVKAALPPAAPGTPAAVIGSPTGSRLDLGAPQLSATMHAAQAGVDFALSADTGKSALVVHPGDGDGFIAALLPSNGLRAEFDLGLAWSQAKGLTWHGSASLDASLPIGLSIGGVTISTVHLSLQVRDTSLLAEVSATIAASIGPVRAVLDRVGIASALTFTEAGGSLGVADLDIGFKPPGGVGLSIDEAVVTGGGFLAFDPDRGQYAGVVELSMEGGIAVKGLGLIATRLPNNVKGFSLLIAITAEGFQPVPLPLGFRLTGIGGLLAVNRTFDEAALAAGLKSHTLESVMFPKDPVRNAPQILSALDRVFPPAAGHHLFGPMAKIEWGTPTLITADLAVVLEFGARLRLLLLARIAAVLPKPENDLICLQMDAVGVLDFDQGSAALDASLYDSRLLKKFVLTGDMAMRLKWEGAPHFALAIGGLHPAFSPPAGFPVLERITLNLTAGDNPRLRCEAYFALTANTVQFGARAEIYAAAHGFSIQGETGFDVLIQLDPFQFLADFYAQVQLKRGSRSLFKVRVEGALAGPRPLHLKAKATFEVLWWDVSIRIDKTLVAGEKPPPPEPIDVLPRLKEALGNPVSWVGRLPAGQRPMVTLRPRAAAAEVLLHPLGTLTVKQGVVPLDMEISRFGSAAPAGARRFTISGVSLGGQPQAPEPVKDFFAPAQFFEMSDDEKLSRPSFEPMTAGVGIGSEEIVFSADASDWLEVAAIEFDTIIVDKEKSESRPSAAPARYRLSPELLGKQARFGAAGGSELRRSGRAKYRTARVGLNVVKEGWSIVATADLAEQPVPGIEAGRPTSYSEAAQALQRLQRDNPAKAAGLRILRPSEVRAID